ncbi:MAG: hypothetical protein O7C59_10190, partial [Rickettsia endosymbiont of Ixodes persulcatus]|nr:hypothetical protein [Rickettsia endosymbiont of Ixodes persulcatus]
PAAASAPSHLTSKSNLQSPKANPRKRRHSPSPHAPTTCPKPTASTPSPFASQLSSFIHPELRAHSSGYYTLSAPQLFALNKWKTTLTRQQMFDNPRNRAFLATNSLLYKHDENNADAPLEDIIKAEDAPVRGVMEIGGLVVEVSADEVRNRELSAVLKGVDERVEREFRRLGYVDKPYKGSVTLRVGKAKGDRLY